MDAYSPNASLTSFFFIEMPVRDQESERSVICVLGISILPLTTILIFDFVIAPTMLY